MKSSVLRDARAIVFDVFGTLAEIRHKKSPYARLMRILQQSGRRPCPDDAARIMSHSVDLEQAARLFGVEVPVGAIASLNDDLRTELSSVALFPDSLPSLTALRTAGYKVGLCSNLAMPYAEPVKKLLPWEPDACAWSFEVGAVKPDAKIYESVCDLLDLPPEKVIMVGDTFGADYLGARRFGMRAVYLARKEARAGCRSISSLNCLLPLLR